jgi:hypothetical protein
MQFLSDVNPYWEDDTNSQYYPRVMAWCGILGDHTIGPFFFEGSEGIFLCYLQMLELNESPESSEALFQLDKSSGHWAVSVRNWIDNEYSYKLIGRDGPIAWPPRTPFYS